ncbi:type II secretion system F family protein [Pseudobacteroides cellulosolvens]|uniref:Type II secretion system F domain-containing protein n=1 Tax=Pseudobacteroides cellulosolvens ATCC 35603 = DSM 2933 TaxID=398512 RepID=A0A0L6JLM7_9FIRM|nr:type II secretion system F family protein [Pseudobacteroides cellulosolvens]KNY26711.1 Type II secretion system F domain-containing protein [Pseudobacteroides cellulosolvens ATCC 35603 = DSM 2933]
MASFAYTAKTSAGAIVTGKFDANDVDNVVSFLRNKGLFPMDIKEVTAVRKGITSKSRKRISSNDLAIFCRQFYTMVNAGVSVIGCLDLLRKQTENTKLAELINEVYDDVQKGNSLSEALSLHSNTLPVILISMIEVGEVSGTLDMVLDKLAAHFIKENRIRQKIKTAMMYPMIIGFIAVAVVIFMLAFVVPKFMSMFSSMGTGLPLPTKILLGISHTISNIWFLIGAASFISVAYYLFSKFKRTVKGRLIITGIILKIPKVGKNYRKILASRFSRALSLLLETGVPLIQALEVVEKVVNNQVVSDGLVKVKEEIKRGSSLASPLEGIGIFPVMVTQMISIGEEAGSLDEIIGKVADFYDEELDTSISQLISLIEPVMILVLALIVGFIVIAMIMPVFGMYKNMG